MRKAIFLLLLGSLLAAPAAAQTLLEVQTATAISLKLDPQVRLPRGSYRALGPGVQKLIAKMRGVDGYGEWEAYVAKGLARRLRPVFVRQVEQSFAASGYLLSGQKAFTVSTEKHQQYVFEGPSGRRALLYVIETPGALYWLVGWSR